MQAALLSLITMLSLTTVALSGQPEPSANVGQTDAPAPIACPSSGPPLEPPTTFVELPGVALTTTGGPVLILSNVETFSRTGSGVTIVDFMVDGASLGAAMRQNFLNGVPISLSPSRVVSVSAGAHTFGVRVACPASGNAVDIVDSWVIAYELPLVRR